MKTTEEVLTKEFKYKQNKKLVKKNKNYKKLNLSLKTGN